MTMAIQRDLRYFEPQPASDQAVADAPLSERIRAILPNHTHCGVGGLLAAFNGQEWTWTTPAGVWKIRLGGSVLGRPALYVEGPGGQWELGHNPDEAFRMLHGLLVTLGGITDPESQ